MRVLGRGGKPGCGGYGVDVSATMVSGAKGAVWTGLAVAKVGNTTLGSCTAWSGFTTLSSCTDGRGTTGCTTLGSKRGSGANAVGVSTTLISGIDGL